MIFFSEKKLARKLHEGHVTEKEQMIYLSLYVMTCAFFSTNFIGYSLYQDAIINIYSYLFDSVTILVTFGTLFYCSLLNRSGDNRDIIARYIALSVPLNIKFMPLLFIMLSAGVFLDTLSATTSHISDAYSEQGPNESTDEIQEITEQDGPYVVLLYLMCALFLMWRYKCAFNIASGKVELK